MRSKAPCGCGRGRSRGRKSGSYVQGCTGRRVPLGQEEVMRAVRVVEVRGRPPLGVAGRGTLLAAVPECGAITMSS